jgi:hypothetical protein
MATSFAEFESAYLSALIQGVEDIKNNPDHWDQRSWHCGSSHCLAGFCDVRREAEKIPEWDREYGDNISPFADEYPHWGDSAEIFHTNNTLQDIEAIIDHIRENGFEYDRDGYDCEGYDGGGYDRDEYDREGYDCEGYDRDGYDCEGYDCCGYDRDGYDCEGYDCRGYDRDGYDCEGLNQNTV